MTPRSIRRAAERKANKAALKAERNAAPSEAVALSWENESSEDENAVEAALFTPPSLSAAQLAANRANAQLSSGPTSAEGKAKTSLNAVKTGLTGRTVLLSADDTAAYQQHVRAYAADFRPVGQRESDLVQSIADTAWRLKRIPCLEAAIFAQGHVEFADMFTDHAPELRPSMIELQTYLQYEKQLRNLQLQESRLTRRREKEIAELKQVQQERRAAEQEALESSVQPSELAEDGFVFSTEQIEAHLALLDSRRRPSEMLSYGSKSAPQAA